MVQAQSIQVRQLAEGDQFQQVVRGKRVVLTMIRREGTVTRGRNIGAHKLQLEDENGAQFNWTVRPDMSLVLVGKANKKKMDSAKGRREATDEKNREHKAKKNKKRQDALDRAEVQPWNMIGMMAEIRFKDGSRKRQILRTTPNSVYVRTEGGHVDISVYRRDNPERPLTRRDIRSMDAMTAIAALGMDTAPKTQRVDLRFVENVSPAEKELPWQLTADDKKKLNKGEAVRKTGGREFIGRSIVVANDPNTVANRRWDYECASGTTFRDPATGFCWRATGSFD